MPATAIHTSSVIRNAFRFGLVERTHLKSPLSESRLPYIMRYT